MNKKTTKSDTKKDITEGNKTTSANKNSGINLHNKFVLAFLLLLLITAGLVGYKTYQQYYAQKQAKKTVVKQVIVRRSKIPNVIVNATTAKTIDVKTGKVILAARVFSLADKTVYLALDLDSAKAGTFIDYIRYLNGRYVDHGNVKLSKDATDNINFSWTNVRPLGSVADGKWKIATYTNGILEKRVNYEVKKNLVSDVHEEPVTAMDTDYELAQVFTSVAKSN